MKTSALLIATLAITLLPAVNRANAQVYYGQGQFGYGQHQAEEAWEQRGVSDGMRGAERDFQNHRRPDVNNRDEYRRPRVPGWARHEYREGFERGYNIRARQIYRGGRERDFDRDWDRRW